MAVEDLFATLMSPPASGEDVDSQPKPAVQRRSFLKGMGVAGVALSAGALLPAALGAEEKSGSLSKGDAAILRFLAAAEIIESDLWLQYQELGGVQDDEVSKLASQLIPGYPSQPTGGNSLYMQDLVPLDGDMSQYIHDNTEDEMTHEVFINATWSRKARIRSVSINSVRCPAAKPRAPTNSAAHQPHATHRGHQLVHPLPQPHPKPGPRGHIPAGDSNSRGWAAPCDSQDRQRCQSLDFLQAIANTAGFHFATIEQGGTSFYA